MLRIGMGVFSICGIFWYSGGISAQTYPTKPVRIVTSSIGGGGDFASRLIAQGISGPLGQQIIIDNRGGQTPGPAVLQASPDGHTLLVHGATFWISPLLQKMPYDVVNDFLPISLLTKQPNILVVHPSVTAKSVKDVIDLAKAKPGALNVATGSPGGGSYLAAELFRHMAGIKIAVIPYGNAAVRMADMLGGDVHMAIDGANTLEAPMKLGKLRALAVTTTDPSPLVPGLPSVAQSGLPGFEFAQTSAIFAPAKTPGAVITRLNQEIVRFLKTPEAKERFFSSGVEAIGSTPEELAATIRSEVARLGKMIREVGIKAQ